VGGEVKPNDPRINDFVQNIRHIIERGRAPEELVRMSFQFAYASGFNDGLFADPEGDMSKLLKQAAHTDDARSVRDEYFPETKTCPKCGHKWGGA
jgi:hypothetical protein